MISDPSTARSDDLASPGSGHGPGPQTAHVELRRARAGGRGRPLARLALASALTMALAAGTLVSAIDGLIADPGAAPRRPVPPPPPATAMAPRGAPPSAAMTGEGPSTTDRPLRPRGSGRPPASSPPPPPGDASPPSTGFTAMLGRLRDTVERGVDAGEIRDDVGVDLRNLIASAREVDPDDSARVRERTGALKDKVQTRVREGGIARRRGDDLLRILSAG
ncbi:hypothetical protein ACQP1W_16455 [Spirillospora sp. CA-255316]